MITPTTFLRSLSLPFLLFVCPACMKATTEHALYLDGKVRTDGVPLDGTRVLVERDGIVIQMFTESVGRMFVRLDLHRTYVLTFERTGCLTKRLLFDTHVPIDGLEHAPFTFPFKVTLEKNEEAAVLHYAQPVGFIRYFDAKRDFDYDTNYRMRRDQQEREDRMAQNGSYAEENARAIALVDRLMAEEGERSAANSAAGSFTRACNVVGSETSFAHDPGTALEPPISPFIPAEHSAAVLAPITSLVASPAKGATIKSSTTDVKRPSPVDRIKPVVAYAATPAPPDGRTEELVVEKNAVATIVRITKNGYTREYRRIAHGYGDIHFFCNGSSCSESSYSAGILQK